MASQEVVPWLTGLVADQASAQSNRALVRAHVLRGIPFAAASKVVDCQLRFSVLDCGACIGQELADLPHFDPGQRPLKRLLAMFVVQLNFCNLGDHAAVVPVVCNADVLRLPRWVLRHRRPVHWALLLPFFRPLDSRLCFIAVIANARRTQSYTRSRAHLEGTTERKNAIPTC